MLFKKNNVSEEIVSASEPSLTPEEKSIILNLLSQGRKIEAIDKYRKATGAGLAEAKEIVEGFQEG